MRNGKAHRWLGYRDTTNYESPIKVNCSDCRIINEADTEFINIESDIMGQDVLTFRCNFCGMQRKSLRFS